MEGITFRDETTNPRLVARYNEATELHMVRTLCW
jgi:hypothetical protein